MDTDLKHLLIIIPASVVIFWVFKPRADGKGIFASLGTARKREDLTMPVLDEDAMQSEDLRTAYTCLSSYIEAWNAGEDDATLEELKKEFKDEFNMVIYKAANGKMAVRDTEGHDILKYGE